MSVISMLRRIGLIPHVSRSDFDEADDENVRHTAVMHRATVEQAVDAAKRVTASNGKLRESIEKIRSTAFADLERSFQRHGGRARDR